MGIMNDVTQISTLTGLTIRFGIPIEIGIHEVPLRLSKQAMACLVYLATTRTLADAHTLRQLFGITHPGMFAFSVNYRAHETVLIEHGNGVTLNADLPLVMEPPRLGYLDGFPAITPYAFAWAEMQKHALREALPGDSPPQDVLVSQAALAAAALRAGGSEITPLSISLMLDQPVHRCVNFAEVTDSIVPPPYWHSRAAYMLRVIAPDQPEAIARQARLAGDIVLARRVLIDAALNGSAAERARYARAALTLPGTSADDRFTLYTVLVQYGGLELSHHVARVRVAEISGRSDWMAEAHADYSHALQMDGQPAAAKSAARRAARYAQRAANASASMRAFIVAAGTLSTQEAHLDALLFLERGLYIGSASTDFPVLAVLAADLAVLYQRTGSTYRASITADRAMLYAFLAEDHVLMTLVNSKIRFVKPHFRQLS